MKIPEKFWLLLIAIVLGLVMSYVKPQEVSSNDLDDIIQILINTGVI